MLKAPVKRFYKHADSEAFSDGFGITLDGRKVNTPTGAPLVIPGSALAQQIAAEWQEQVDKIKPETMPMMRLACTTIDKVAPNRQNLADQLTDYGANDLLCYRADGPDELVTRQNDVWQPILDWASESYGAGLLITSGIVHIAQPVEVVENLRHAVDDHDDFELTALAEITQLTGSLVLGLAVSCGHIDWLAAFEASQLDETWQNERWGEDYEAADRRDNRRKDMEMADRYLKLVRD